MGTEFEEGAEPPEELSPHPRHAARITTKKNAARVLMGEAQNSEVGPGRIPGAK
jgi:hypothetical protein